MSLRNSKITQDEALGIRTRVAAAGDARAAQIRIEADRYLVGIETIRRVVRGETFRFAGESVVSEALVQPQANEPSQEEIEASLARLRKLQEAEAGISHSPAVDEFMKRASSPKNPLEE
jgi:hypothetical protein